MIQLKSLARGDLMVLSNVDIERALLKGRHIRIHPFKQENLKGSTYNLTASEHAWIINPDKLIVDIEQNQLSEGKIEQSTDKEVAEPQDPTVQMETQNIVKNGFIEIPPNKSVLIATQEVIWVSSKICGTYHSKVSIVSSGAGHIGTTLDPEWIGHSLITVHNHSNKTLKIKVGKTFVSIMFYYMRNRSTKFQGNYSSQINYLTELIEETRGKDLFSAGWETQPEILLEEMEKNTDYKRILVKRKRGLRKYYYLAVIIIIITIVVANFVFKDQNTFFSYFLSLIVSVFLSGLLVGPLKLDYFKE